MRYIFSVILALSCTVSGMCELPSVAAGTLERHKLYSESLRRDVTVDVWMPDSYETAGTGLPVLYMHDGQNVFDPAVTWNHQAWEVDNVTDSLVRAGVITAPLVVAIHSVDSTRISDLAPTAVREYAGVYADSLGRFSDMELRGREYAEFVTGTLKPFIDSTYNVLTDRDNTAVMGSSMGGLISLYMICEYPEVFGGAACLSTHWPGDATVGSHFPEAMLAYMDARLPDAAAHRLYFDYGTGAYDINYAPWQPKADAVAMRHGYVPGVNFCSFVDYGATHNEDAWSRRVYIPLKFLFHKN
ncbi:MAG: hypothetical protein K2M79_00080 [Muribaculaceae bacterium]|nr:hypothetical protein [Muribaculaceae bacterium]